MANTIHIKGWANEINILDKFQSNYDLPSHSFPFDNEGEDSFKAFIRIYYGDKPMTLDEAIEGWVRKMSGAVHMIGQETGYSEYTIEGFDVRTARFGGHDLNDILNSHIKDKHYVHILIDEIE